MKDRTRNSIWNIIIVIVLVLVTIGVTDLIREKVQKHMDSKIEIIK